MMGNTYDNDVTELGGLPYVKNALNLPKDFPKSKDLPQSPVRKTAPRRPVKSVEVTEEEG